MNNLPENVEEGEDGLLPPAKTILNSEDDDMESFKCGTTFSSKCSIAIEDMSRSSCNNS